MKGLILAAGRGSRMGGMTDGRPKCLIPLAGRPLLDYQVAALRMAGIRDIAVIGGYLAERLAGRGLRLLTNPRWETTNMVATLACARPFLDGDFVLSYGDIAYHPGYVSGLAADPAGIAVAVDRRWLDLWSLRFADPYADAETMVIDGEGLIRELGGRITDPAAVQGQYTGLMKFSGGGRAAALELLGELEAGAPAAGGRPFDRMYMTDFLQTLIDRGVGVKAMLIDNGWLEMDSGTDHALYESLARRRMLAKYFDPEAYSWDGWEEGRWSSG